MPIEIKDKHVQKFVCFFSEIEERKKNVFAVGFSFFSSAQTAKTNNIDSFRFLKRNHVFFSSSLLRIDRDSLNK